MSADTGLPDTFAALAGTCAACGDVRDPGALTEGVCGRCLKAMEVAD